MKRTPRPPEFDWSRITNKRLQVLSVWAFVRRGGRKRLRKPTRIVGGMRAYWLRREEQKREQAKLPMSKMRWGHGRPINRPVQ